MRRRRITVRPLSTVFFSEGPVGPPEKHFAGFRELALLGSGVIRYFQEFLSVAYHLTFGADTATGWSSRSSVGPAVEGGPRGLSAQSHDSQPERRAIRGGTKVLPCWISATVFVTNCSITRASRRPLA